MSTPPARLAILAVALILAACGSGSSDGGGSSSDSSGGGTSDNSLSPVDSNFLSTLRDLGVDVNHNTSSEAWAIDLAQKICTAKDGGADDGTIEQTMVDSSRGALSSTDAQVFLGAAEAAYCPQDQ